MCRWIGLIVLCLLAAGCSEGGDGEVFLPIISNTWDDASNSNHFFSLESNDDGEPHGSFIGRETHPDFGNYNLSGTFNGRDVRFTIDISSGDESRAHGDITYTGEFVTPDRMELSSSVGALTLVRQQQ